MSTYIGQSRASTLDHFVRLGAGAKRPYLGMTTKALCGSRVSVDPDRTAGTAPGFVQPVGTCKRCAAVLGQSVRSLG